MSLQALPSKVLVSQFEQQRKKVLLSWQKWFYASSVEIELTRRTFSTIDRVGLCYYC
ncbi:hypothetical protein [Arsenophonus endosymbiont of Bemisia tabaci]|uniref:hypothetical protein n=1 Tax=Arsenophonus endosymbiont of Bemisia tabaci TaxID=536059 RepID=UPI0015F749FF|nr:hypothetical protein [Arsenophonus endosymbiont of Bemisia tabaci]